MKAFLVVLAAALLAGCDSLSYYGQAIGGHFKLMAQAKPLDTWLADPGTPADLKQRLETARGIREFASRELHLPDNGSYTTYADLNRRFAVYNVFAAPKFSVDPKPECFPITGCVAYRGFFSEKDADAYADRLRAQGFDVYTGGVLAYSTLGGFDDPLLSTFIRYPDAQGRTADLAAFRTAQERKRDLAARIKETRERLKTIYAAKLTPEQMLEQKKGEFDRLRALYPTFVPKEPNNAFLVSIALYNEFVPALERVLAASGSLDAFYERARALAHEDREQRDALLASAN